MNHMCYGCGNWMSTAALLVLPGAIRAQASPYRRPGEVWPLGTLKFCCPKCVADAIIRDAITGRNWGKAKVVYRREPPQDIVVDQFHPNPRKDRLEP
ncbi:hypothetical protein LCGC14_0897470 [marine sediment metagenome]|uniref:Uncharacterized protein n=1 Tax=marine sediment metagenome TaxID=412755 RepID=A0A0F9RGH2_9ZZZZ